MVDWLRRRLADLRLVMLAALGLIVLVLPGELALLLGGLVGALDGLTGDLKIFHQAVQLVPAAAVACAGTYLLSWLIAAVVGWARQVSRFHRTPDRDARSGDDRDPVQHEAADISGEDTAS